MDNNRQRRVARFVADITEEQWWMPVRRRDFASSDSPEVAKESMDQHTSSDCWGRPCKRELAKSNPRMSMPRFDAEPDESVAFGIKDFNRAT